MLLKLPTSTHLLFSKLTGLAILAACSCFDSCPGVKLLFLHCPSYFSRGELELHLWYVSNSLGTAVYA